jgi:glycosyltransferase involved in cell wall biosynthesis
MKHQLHHEIEPRPVPAERGMLDIVVCVPTFRRPEMLVQTLQSLVDQCGAPPFGVIVVDNDAVFKNGASVAAQFFDDRSLNGLCVIERQQGNCHAINRAFSVAREEFQNARYFLMIDDDEVADPNWLRCMVEAAETHAADIVGGPVVPRFTGAVERHVSEHPVYWPSHHESGVVPMIYGSGNCLIRRGVFDRLENPAFDVRFNFLGGGDTEFFTRCRTAGFSFYWSQEARIVETVPEDRLKTAWILRRGLRIGAINHRIDSSRMRSASGRLRLLAKNLAVAVVSIGRGLRFLRRGKGVLTVIHPCVIAAGRILASIGLEPQQYRANPRKAPLQ